MKRLAMGSMSIAILWAATSLAQDVNFRPAGGVPAFQRVTPSTSSSSANSAEAEPIVTLSRPTALPAPGTETPAFQRINLDRPTPLFRAKAFETEDIPQLMPIGPAPDTTRQPGTVKPMVVTQEPAKGPKGESFIAPLPAPSGRNTTGWTTTPVPGTVIVNEGYGGDSYGTCGSCCGGCDGCGPWGGWLRSRLAWNGPGWSGAGWGGACCDSGCGSCGDVGSAPCGSPCGSPCGDICGGCGSCGMFGEGCCLPRPHWFVRADYLLWGFSNQRVPPLLTTDTATVGIENAGVLPGATILLGEDQVTDDMHSGARIQAGFWFAPCANWGIDASGFYLAPRTISAFFASNANGSPVLARPFFQPNFDGIAAGEAAEIVSFPGAFAGAFSYESTTKLWGFDVNLRRKLCCGPRWWLDGQIGYRHVQLNDTIDIREAIVNLDAGEGDVAAFFVHDHFATKNTFNGGQIGLEGELRLWRRWSLGGNVKVAIGDMRQQVDIDGSTVFVQGDGPNVTGKGGLFALVSNIGQHSTNTFAVVPEFGIKLNFDITDHLRIYAGYNLLYMSSVVRAGEQIDRVVNFQGMAPSVENPNPRIVNPARPAVLFRQTDFWAQGGQFGMEYHW